MFRWRQFVQDIPTSWVHRARNQQTDERRSNIRTAIIPSFRQLQFYLRNNICLKRCRAPWESRRMSLNVAKCRRMSKSFYWNLNIENQISSQKLCFQKWLATFCDIRRHSATFRDFSSVARRCNHSWNSNLKFVVTPVASIFPFDFQRLFPNSVSPNFIAIFFKAPVSDYKDDCDEKATEEANYEFWVFKTWVLTANYLEFVCWLWKA